MSYTAVIYRDKKEPRKKGFLLYLTGEREDEVKCITYHKPDSLNGELPIVARAKRSELEDIFPDCEVVEIDSLIEIWPEFNLSR